MKVTCSKGIGVVFAGAFLISAALCAQSPWSHRAECSSPSGLPAGADVDDMTCLPQAKRIALLSQPVKQAGLVPLDRDHQLHSALHQLQAQQSEALAMADPSATHALDAYLNGRAIESRRSTALRDPKRELARSQSRMILMSTNLVVATKAAADWIRRQPGRGLPPPYQQRIAAAAAAILAEDVQRQRLVETCEEVNQDFDRKLRRVLTLRG